MAHRRNDAQVASVRWDGGSDVHTHKAAGGPCNHEMTAALFIWLWCLRKVLRACWP